MKTPKVTGAGDVPNDDGLALVRLWGMAVMGTVLRECGIALLTAIAKLIGRLLRVGPKSCEVDHGSGCEMKLRRFRADK